jgi:uncharacterized membrane protein
MGFFVFAALLGAGLFLAILFATPPQNIIANYLGARLNERFLNWSNASGFWFVLALVAPLVIWLLLLVAIVGIVHWRSGEPVRESVFILRDTAGITDIILSPAFTSVVLGLVFGAVLSLWLYQLYRLNHKATDLDWKIKVEGVALALLFVFGSGVLGDRWIDRIEKLSFAGAEVDLSPGAPRQNGAQSPRLVVTAPGTSASGATRASFGLYQLAQLEGTMKRDNASLENSGHAVDATPESAVAFVKRFVSRLAHCHQSIYDASSDRNFIKNQYAALLPGLRKFVRSLEFGAPSDDATALSDFGKAYAAVVGDTIARVYVEEATPLDSQLSARPWLKARQTEIDSMREACQPLLNVAREPYDGPELRAIAADQIGVLEIGVAASFANDFAADLKPDNAGMQARPYLAIILASVEAILEEPEAALKELDDWIATAPDYYNNTPINPHSFARQWYEVRARSAMYFISEEWIRKSFFVPPEVRVFSINNLERVVKDLRSFQIYEDGLAAYSKRKQSIELDFSKLEDDVGDCELSQATKYAPNDPEYLRAYAGYVYVLFLALDLDKLLDARLDNVIDDEKYSNASRVYLHQLNKVDLSCYARIDKRGYDEQKARIYAEILRLNARMLLVDAVAMRNLTDADQKKKAVKRAFDATSLGLSILGPFNKADHVARDENTEPRPNFLQKTDPSDVIETYDRLASMHKELNVQLNDRDGG